MVDKIILKSGWICIRDRKVLFARSFKNPDIFYIPGGKREVGETDEEALVREIKEETTVSLLSNTIQYQETFLFHAHGKPANVKVQLKAFTADYDGELQASEEISELAWLDSSNLDKVYGVGVLVIDWLKDTDLIN